LPLDRVRHPGIRFRAVRRLEPEVASGREGYTDYGAHYPIAHAFFAELTRWHVR